MTAMKQLAMLWPVCLAVACSGGATAPTTVGPLDERVALGTCERDVRCGNIGASELAACKADASTRATKFPPSYSIDDAIKDKRLSINVSEAERCIAASKDAPCTVDGIFVLLEACDRLYLPAVMPGGACKSDYECIGGTCARASGDTGCPGTCKAYVATGGDCAAEDATCAPSDFCHGDTQVCTLRAGKDAACDDKIRCGLAFSCTGQDAQTGAGGTCTAPSPVGTTCESYFFGNTSCDPALYCDSSTQKCAARGATGAECNGFYACDDGFVCIGLTFDEDGNIMTPGRCTAPLDVGQTCDPSFGETGCPLSTSCDMTSRQCIRTETPERIPFGMPCTPPADENAEDPCDDGVCDPSTRTCALICG